MVPLSANSGRFLSPVCEVFFAGWRTDTVTLQQCGWEIAAEQEPYDMSVRLFIQHRALGLRGLTNRVSKDLFELRHGYLPGPPFEIIKMASGMTVELREKSFAFHQIDAMPQFMNMNPTQNVDAFNIFASSLARTEEIIVDPKSVSELLAQIREMQSPEQGAIRARRQRRDRGTEAIPREVFHAQILSLAA